MQQTMQTTSLFFTFAAGRDAVIAENYAEAARQSRKLDACNINKTDGNKEKDEEYEEGEEYEEDEEYE